MSLSEAKLRNIKARLRPYKVFDEKGLYVLIDTSGGIYWRIKYRFQGKEKTLALGSYPTISLAEARDKRDEARKLHANGIDPSEAKQAKKRSERLSSENTFEAIAIEWLEIKWNKWTEKYANKIKRRLQMYLFPFIGKKNISEITTPEILEALRKIEKKEYIDTARRVNQLGGQVFRYAIACGRIKHNPAETLCDALKTIETRNFPTIVDPKKIGCLLQDLYNYQGAITTQYALQLLPLVFVRPGELRQAEWKEFHWDEAQWHIASKRTKKRRLHIVPLATQAINILRELHQYTGNGKYLFPGTKSDRCMSENTINSAIRRLGYSTQEDITGHGFRHMASTILNDKGWNGDAVERQLAHLDPNKTRKTYNHAEYLPLRHEMMQFWSDYLMELMTRHNEKSFLRLAA